MSIIETLITDRKASDVLDLTNLLSVPYENWTKEQKEKFGLGNNKGSYNASDLNRVGAAMNYVADRLRDAGYAPHISPKTDWSETDLPTVGTMTRYLADLAELRSQFTQMQTTPTVPTDMGNLTWREANDIEQILVDLDFLLTKMSLAWFYGGEIQSGEV